MRWIFAGAVCALMTLSAVAQTIAPPAPTPLVKGKRALARNDFAGAKAVFAEYVRTHPGDVQGELGLGDAELGLHHFETAERIYRRIVAAQPLTWQAHKNLVIVEAALGRWEDFDGERTVLRAARERNATGIDRHESDVIDVIIIHGQRWIVRDYFEPLGRARARYNFERFSPDGRILEYVSLESADAFPKELNGRAVVVGPPAKEPDTHNFALDWYNGKSHGTVKKYVAEPKYERVRLDFINWLVRGH
jgi:tetratricopeptide (TPR) repeat protein